MMGNPLLDHVADHLEEVRARWAGRMANVPFRRTARSPDQIVVVCTVQEVRYAYGRTEGYVIPVVGKGGCWVDLSSLDPLPD